jgi:hypothetical protein
MYADRNRLIAAVAFGLLLPLTAAKAQLIAGQGLGSAGAGAGPLFKPKNAAPTPAAPTALPGAQTDPSRVAPADKSIHDTPPNEALFDGINRGDIATVRDAISRGADLGSQSVLGQSPLELSIDLGRNDITFLLLSLRGTGDSSRSARPPAQLDAQTTAKGRKAAAAAATADRAEAQAQAKARAHPTTTGVAAREPVPAPIRASQEFASGNGGTPNPAVGFLGFGSSTQR